MGEINLISWVVSFWRETGLQRKGTKRRINKKFYFLSCTEVISKEEFEDQWEKYLGTWQQYWQRYWQQVKSHFRINQFIKGRINCFYASGVVLHLENDGLGLIYINKC